MLNLSPPHHLLKLLHQRVALRHFRILEQPHEFSLFIGF